MGTGLPSAVHSVDLSPNELIMAVTCGGGVQLHAAPGPEGRMSSAV